MKMARIESHREEVKKVQPITSLVLPPAVAEWVMKHRQAVLDSRKEDVLQEYISQATDEECLCALAELALRGPLRDEYKTILDYLGCNVFQRLNLDIPEEFQDGDDDLSATLARELDTFRRGIRQAQYRTYGLEVLKQ